MMKITPAPKQVSAKATADDALSADDELAQWRRKKGHANQG
jgi:hypothetical protein